MLLVTVGVALPEGDAVPPPPRDAVGLPLPVPHTVPAALREAEPVLLCCALRVHAAGVGDAVPKTAEPDSDREGGGVGEAQLLPLTLCESDSGADWVAEGEEERLTEGGGKAWQRRLAMEKEAHCRCHAALWRCRKTLPWRPQGRRRARERMYPMK